MSQYPDVTRAQAVADRLGIQGLFNTERWGGHGVSLPGVTTDVQDRSYVYAGDNSAIELRVRSPLPNHIFDGLTLVFEEQADGEAHLVGAHAILDRGGKNGFTCLNTTNPEVLEMVSERLKDIADTADQEGSFVGGLSELFSDESLHFQPDTSVQSIRGMVPDWFDDCRSGELELPTMRLARSLEPEHAVG